MSETKPSETKPKKMVSRSVAMALGIICILLIAVIAYFSITGISAQNSYNNLQNQNKQLQTWLSGNETLLNQTQANNANLLNQYANLQSQANNLSDALNLQELTVWVDSESVNIMGAIFEENASFAGYISVQVSSGYNMTVEVSYLSHGVSYNNSTFIGFSGGTAYFPVLPSPNISIYIFQNFLLTGPLYVTVTITYYY